jgi:hypothetical protein
LIDLLISGNLITGNDEQRGCVMTKFKFKTIANILGVFAVFAIVAAPTMSIADASNPAVTQTKAKAKPKARIRKRVVRAKIVQPAPPPPVQEAVVAEPPAPPLPEPAPAPQVVEAPAAPTPPAAPLSVAKRGGSGWLLGVLGAAAVVGGIVVLADDNPASS